MTLITSEYPNSWYRASAELLPERGQPSRRRFGRCLRHGAGYTGLSAALHLAKAGKQVAILEASRVGWGRRGATVVMSALGSAPTNSHSRNGTAKIGLESLGDRPGCGRLSRIVSKGTRHRM